MATTTMDRTGQAPDAPARPAVRRSVQQPGFRLGSIRGIAIRLDWSLVVIFLLIAFNLGAGLLPALHPDWSPLTVWATALAAAVAFFASVLAHELAHALVGRRQGIAVDGITLFVFGGMAHLRGEPGSPRAEFFMTIVGPLTSLALGILCWLAGAALASRGAATPIPEMLMQRANPLATVLLWLGPVNVFLGVFNLLPGFPLDGGRVLRALLWRITGDLARATRWASNAGRALALGLLFLGTLMLFGGRVPILGGGFVQGMWLVFLGWFLNVAAMRSYEQVIFRELLRGVPVARLMRPDAPRLDANESVDRIADRFLEAPTDRCLPVVEGQDLRGLVCLSDLRKVPRTEWGRRQAAEVMTPMGELAATRPDEDVADALAKLTSQDVDQLPVVEDGQLRGFLRRADVLRWLELQRATS